MAKDHGSCQKKLMEQLCQVAVKYPGHSILTYLVGNQNLKTGQLVRVPLGNRTSLGCVLDPNFKPQEGIQYELKAVGEVVHPDFDLDAKELDLYTWMSHYYHYSLGQLIYDCLPKILKRPQQVELQIGEGKPLEHGLNPRQKEIVDQLLPQLDQGFSKHLIHGVTGSGKTLIYLHLIKSILARGKSALFLVPEINLTPQLTKTFLDFLDCPVYCYHSGITPSEKNRLWKTLKSEEGPLLVIGVRSAVFLPMKKLGLCLIDEEHDPSFKQTDRCPYHGRDVAIKKSQLMDCPIVMGSATPSVENYFRFRESGHYFEMTERVSRGALPEVHLVDERSKEKDFPYWPLTPQSLQAITGALEKNEQVLVFNNRLGFANFLQCRACGYRFMDPNSDSNLRVFKQKGLLISPYGEYQIPLPEVCPECQNMNLSPKGFGTEKIKEVLEEVFPSKTIGRFDRDEVTNFKKLSQTLDDFHTGKTDILVGTQMLSKGHNFERVNTVVILGIDQQLNFPDFRALEKSYQLLTQVTGRAGRYSPKAEVYVQTLNPESRLFQIVKAHSFNDFYQEEIELRQKMGFPPFERLAALYLSGRFRSKVIEEASIIADRLKVMIVKNQKQVSLMGPTPSPVEKKSNQYTWMILIKSSHLSHLHGVLGYFHKNYKAPSGIKYKIDVDPIQI